jgi:hypothetical protein
MSPAKLLGLPQTEDSIIVRSSAVATQPRAFVHIDAVTQDDDARPLQKSLRSLIAIRMRGGKK